MGVRIVTDSSCDLTEEQATSLGISVVPLSIRFGEDELVDREELAVEEFYERMAAFDGLPETAAPAPGRFEVAFRDLAADGADGVVCINLASDLSATMASALNAQRAVGDDVDVRVVDSRSVTSGLGTQVLACAELAASGASLDEVEALAKDLAQRTRVFATLDSLENLKKGGRIGGAQAMLGTMLSIKPIIQIDGEVHEAGKTRTRKKSFAWMRDKLAEFGAVERLNLRHAAADDFDEFVSVVAGDRPEGSYSTGWIGPVVGTHGGKGCVGITFQLPS